MESEDRKAMLAEHVIVAFVLSTFRTDYILVKEEKFERTLEVLANVESGSE